MFTIIGGDGKEYGPATVEQIRAWLLAGRANLDTKAKAAGSEEWQPLGDYPEFSPSAPPLPPPLSADSSGRLASRWTRLGAWFLDGVFAFACCLPGFVIVGFSLLAEVLTNPASAADSMTPRSILGWLLIGLGGLFVFIVQAWMLTTRGQTLGKRVFGIRIVRCIDGANPGFSRAVLLRVFVPGIIGAIPLLGGIFSLTDVCFIFREDRRCIHDLIAGTRVVEVESKV